mmetsp:Transcript_58322/g.115762  ORF Transcript_58322/g.115762 Transcript_58322/m.115762 type:complete len:234 (+) Transcript_58322:2453-3154(+)
MRRLRRASSGWDTRPSPSPSPGGRGSGSSYRPLVPSPTCTRARRSIVTSSRRTSSSTRGCMPTSPTPALLRGPRPRASPPSPPRPAHATPPGTPTRSSPTAVSTLRPQTATLSASPSPSPSPTAPRWAYLQAARRSMTLTSRTSRQSRLPRAGPRSLWAQSSPLFAAMAMRRLFATRANASAWSSAESWRPSRGFLTSGRQVNARVSSPTAHQADPHVASTGSWSWSLSLPPT